MTDSLVDIIHAGGDQSCYAAILTNWKSSSMPIGERAFELYAAALPEEEIAKSLAAQIKGCDLAGYNSNRFDIPLLAEEFIRAGVDIDLNRRKFVDVQTIYHKMEQRTLAAAYKFYCNKDLNNAHTAEADTMATYEVLKAQLDRYPELQNDIDFLSKYSSYNNNVDFAGRMIYNDKGEEVFIFGKYKGKLVTDVLRRDPNYYEWIINGDFALNTKKILTEIKLRGLNSNIKG